MKTIKELQVEPADVKAITPKVISATMEEIRRGKRIWAQFYRINRDLVGTGGTQVEFPKKGTGVAMEVNMPKGATIPVSKITYDAVTIPIQKHGVGLGFYGEAIRQTKRDIIRDAITEAGEAYADAMDTIALEAMFPTVDIVATGAQTITASGTILIGVKSQTNASEIRISATETAVVFTGAGTLTGWYIPTTAGGRRVTATAGSMSAKDILLVKGDVGSANFQPDVVIIHPKRLPEIFYDPASKFIEASAYRGGGVLYNGELGQMFGLRVIVTTKCPIYGAVVLDTRALGYCVERMDLDLQEDRVTGLRTDMLYFWGFAERNYGVVEEKSYGAVALAGTHSPVEVNPPR